MIIEKIVVGALENNCFIVADEKSKNCFIVDPGDEPDRILDVIRENHFTVLFIICTHAHFDHVAAVSELKRDTSAKLLIHADDLDIYRNTRDQAILWGFEADDQPEPDAFVSEGDRLHVGGLSFEVFHTPGHSPGGICLYGEGVVITGDTLFAGSVGRTDLFGGDVAELKKSFRRLMSLPDDVRVLPGHGPESTIGREKAENFFAHE